MESASKTWSSIHYPQNEKEKILNLFFLNSILSTKFDKMRQNIFLLLLLFTKGAFFSRYYLYGLHYEMMYLNGEFQKSPTGKKLIKEGKSLWEGKLNHLYQNSKGFARDVMLSETLTDGLRYSKGRAVARKYIDLIRDDIMRKALQDKLKNHTDNPNTF